MIAFGRYILFLLVAIICIASGCNVGPDYKRPSTPADSGDGFFNAPQSWLEPNDIASTGRWWQRIGDPVTEELVDKALRNNYDLKAAAAAVIESQALLTQSHGARLPEVSYSAGRTRSKSTLFFVGSSRSIFTCNTFTFIFIISPNTTRQQRYIC